MLYDFVYIVKKDDKNVDLQYSLRSIAKFYPDHKVWIVGYKPNWVQNVNYLPVEQTENKWKNSITNILSACSCKEISRDFILMNDDFFVLQESYPLNVICNSNLGLLDKRIEECVAKKQTSKWNKAFDQVNTLLENIGIEKPYYNYEAHTPLLINRVKFRKMFSLSEVKEFIKTPQVLHKRTLYKNIYKPEILNTLQDDVKIDMNEDYTIFSKLAVCGWFSVFDDQVGNYKYPQVNKVLHENFPEPCIYENTDILNTNPADIKPRNKMVKHKKTNFINY